MTLAVQTDPAPLRTDEHGVVRIGDTRVTLERVVYAFDQGVSAEGIAEMYPSLDLADVHATLAYVLRHRAEVDGYMREVEVRTEETRRLLDERSPQTGLREDLELRLSRRAES